MSDRIRVKVTFTMGEDPELLRELVKVPPRLRAQRLRALATRGAVVQQLGFSLSRENGKLSLTPGQADPGQPTVGQMLDWDGSSDPS